MRNKKLCPAIVHTKLFGDRPCCIKEKHMGLHSPNLQGLRLGDYTIGKRGPSKFYGGQKYATWWAHRKREKYLVRHNSIIVGDFVGIKSPPNSLFQTKIKGKLRPEYSAAANHYVAGHNPKHIQYNTYKNMSYYKKWDKERGKLRAAGVFARNFMTYALKKMPKPTEGKWQLHVGKDKWGIKHFAPGYLSWEPVDDVHIRNKRRCLSDYTTNELQAEINRRTASR